MKLAKIGAIFYLLWGLLHIVGGGSILFSALESADIAYAGFQGSSGGHSALAGGVLAYHGFNILWIGFVVAVIAITLNWKNTRVGAWTNFALVGFLDLGLVIFMLIPGYVPWAAGSIGLGLFALAALFTAMARRSP